MRLGVSVERFIAGYAATTTRSPKTISGYACDLRQFTDHVGPSVQLRRLGAGQIESWLGALQQAGYASATLRRKISAARTFFLYWVRRAELDSSPCWSVRLSLDPSDPIPKVLTEAELCSVLLWARREAIGSLGDRTARLRVHFISLRNMLTLDLLLETGMRVGELASLRLTDVSTVERTLLITGKGRRKRLAFIIDDQTASTLERYLRYREGFASSTAALLVNTFGGPLSTRGVARALARLAHLAGIQRVITPHMIRHTAATLLLRNGMDIRLVQEFLGHASITTTQRYTHISREHLREALRIRHPGPAMHRQLPVLHPR